MVSLLFLWLDFEVILKGLLNHAAYFKYINFFLLATISYLSKFASVKSFDIFKFYIVEFN